MYPCTSCGCCCNRIDKAVTNAKKYLNKTISDFPYEWDNTGKCSKLNSDNKCSVYDTRPLICNINELQKQLDIPKEDFYKLNIQACNSMMDDDNIPQNFRIITNK